MLLHIDGSKHCWFQNSQRYDLIVILDDATSEIYYAQLVEEESTRTVMAGLREVIETKGLFCGSRKSFLCDSEGRRAGRQASPAANRKSDERTGCADDSGVFATGSRAFGAELRNLAGASATGTSAGRHQHTGRG